MTYNFDSELAQQYGVNEAIFIHNIFFWLSHNAANNKHFYKGRYWTYNSKMAFVKLFPFWTYEQVKKIIKNLSDCGVLLKDNFNEKSWDKTIWYSLDDSVLDYYKTVNEATKNALLQKHQSSGEIAPMECGNNTNRLGKSHQSNIGTDNKPYNKTQIEGSLGFLQINFPERYEVLMMQFKSQITDFVKFARFFEAKVQQEKLEYHPDVIEGRFKQFAWHWIERRIDVKVVELNPEQPVRKIESL